MIVFLPCETLNLPCLGEGRTEERNRGDEEPRRREEVTRGEKAAEDRGAIEVQTERGGER